MSKLPIKNKIKVFRAMQDWTQEELANWVAEKAILMLYRVIPTDAQVEHHYVVKPISYLWQKPEAYKRACEASTYDAIFSLNLESQDSNSIELGAYQRELWVKWVDCGSLENWNEEFSVTTHDSGQRLQQIIFKYLRDVFPYFNS